MSRAEDTLWSQYEDLGLIGLGAFSDIHKARHRLTGVTVAIKFLEKQGRAQAVAREVEIMKMLEHPNTVALFHVVDTKDTTYLVLELCQQELLAHISRKGCLQEDEARGIFRQILDAISYCHSRGIVHQDIKPDNIMVDDGGKVTVIDFGLATRFLPGEMLTKYCGAYKYMPPEAISLQPYDGPKKDVWSLGVLLYYMLTRTIPFKSSEHTEVKQKIIAGDYEEPEGLSDELKDLIRRLLTVDPERRPTTIDIIRHPWLQQGQGGSDNPEPPPKQPDTNIISIMEFMKFDADDIVEAIRERKYDDVMATYLLFQAQSRMGGKAEDKAVCPGTTPFPTTTDHAAFPVPPKMKHPAPVFRTLSSGLAAQEQPEDEQQAEPKEVRVASLPNLHISWPKKRPPVKPSPEDPRPVTAPASLCPGPGPQLPPKARGTGKGDRLQQTKPAASTQGGGRRLELREQMGDTSDGDTEPSNRGLRSRLKALRGRIQGCLRRLFHRRPARDLHLFQKRVSPQQAVDIRDDDKASVTPEHTSMCIPCVCGRRDKIRPS
uniref:sperm motility kinase Z-like n=1 Tax=Jaculus jaculus TaxID=51337 RepID=UPI001E1B4127|nr:sperm motility kinase Z-like [Jaculus jaculus]